VVEGRIYQPFEDGKLGMIDARDGTSRHHL
jgi:hypothetical protein